MSVSLEAQQIVSCSSQCDMYRKAFCHTRSAVTVMAVGKVCLGVIVGVFLVDDDTSTFNSVHDYE